MLLGPAGFFCLAVAHGTLLVRGALAVAVAALWIPSVLIDQPTLLRAPTAAANPDGITVMTYNVMAYHLSESGVLGTISETNPDVLCLVEGTFAGRRPPNVAARLGSEYNWAVGTRLSIASRLPIVESRMVSQGDGVLIMRAVLEKEGTPFVILLVDIDPPQRRGGDRHSFSELWTMVRLEEKPLIVTGDLNVPRGSYHLRRAVHPLEDSFLAAPAHRYLATWPSFVPLWQLDYTFCGNGFITQRAEILRSYASDHLPILVTLELAE